MTPICFERNRNSFSLTATGSAARFEATCWPPPFSTFSRCLLSVIFITLWSIDFKFEILDFTLSSEGVLGARTNVETRGFWGT
jgi:hypothetical protein